MSEGRRGVDIPLCFLCSDDRLWPELRNGAVPEIDGDRLSKLSGGIVNNWIQRTYYHLRRAGVSAEISATARPDAINFASVFNFGRRDRRTDCFYVFPIGDGHDSTLADFRIRQNGVRPPGRNEAVIWHWPQPGIRPRDPGRGERLETLCFKGRMLNLDPAFRSDDFLWALRGLGIGFEIDALVDRHGAHDWNDYSAADAVLAVRNLTAYDAEKKPASKLVNAWFAELPAILGPEPAFRELRRGPDDYIEVRSADEALQALRHLKENPVLYRRMVENGRTRRAEFTEARLTDLWRETIAGPVTRAYLEWQARPASLRTLGAATGMVLDRFAQRRDRRRIATGRRILDAATG